jgi:cytoskeletal protein CcmA (bactofilin family)
MPTDTKTPKQTLVEAGTEFTGTLQSSCPVVVNGKLDGHINAPTLNITSTGAVQGTIRAKTLRSSGTLAGNIDAGEVYVSGVVRSKTVIRARRLEFKIGSPKGDLHVTFGTCNVELPSAPEASMPSSPSASEHESYGNAGWELPEADGSGVRAPANVSVERARSK